MNDKGQGTVTWGGKSIACQAPVVRGAVSGLVPIRSAAVTVAPRLPCLTVVLMLLFVFLCLTSGSCWSSGLPSALLSVANMTASSLLTLDNRKANFALCSLNRSLNGLNYVSDFFFRNARASGQTHAYFKDRFAHTIYVGRSILIARLLMHRFPDWTRLYFGCIHKDA